MLGYVSDVRHPAFCEVSFADEFDITYTANFTKVDVSALEGFYKYDPGGNWSDVNSWYTCPVSGVYRVTTKLRPSDYYPATSWGQGANTSLSDGPWFSWFVTDAQSMGQRNGSLNMRTSHFNAGEHIFMYCYCDDPLNIEAGSMTVELLYVG